MKKFCIVLLTFFLIVSSGCVLRRDLKGSMEIDNYDLQERDTTHLTVLLDYYTWPDNETKNFKILFGTGDHLEVEKDGSVIPEDVIRNVTTTANQSYILRATNLPYRTNQKVVNLVVVITSLDGKQSVSLTSDFIVISR